MPTPNTLNATSRSQRQTSVPHAVQPHEPSTTLPHRHSPTTQPCSEACGGCYASARDELRVEGF